MNAPVAKLPASRRTAYQFPVYRWIGWLAVAAYGIGLTAMFFIAGLFGIPPPLGWAFLVIVFTISAMLLDHPKLLLGFMILYFMLMPGNRILGLFGVPLPGFIDELFFLPFIAVIVMNWIQRRQIKEATFFPLAFCLIAALSWYVNGKPSVFTAVRITLVMLKSYILWYFCRLTCTFESQKQMKWWFWAYVVFVMVQFFYNVLWQRGPWPRNVDMSGGVFGPDSYGSHLIAYLCVFALLMIAGWWVSVGYRSRPRVRWKVFLMTLIIAYNLVFMTDAKHVLVLFPFVLLVFLLHPRVPIRLRIGLMSAFGVFILASAVYINMATGQARLAQIFDKIEDTPKGRVFYAVTVDFRHLVPFPVFGAGPGRFTSDYAREDATPLARQYILPYYDEARRLGYFKRRGTTVISSVVGSVNTDFFVLMGEFGWLETMVYYGFFFWVTRRLFQKSLAVPRTQFESGFFMALACCVLFLMIITLVTCASTVPPLVFPLWILIGRAWDMHFEEEQPGIPAVAEA